MDSGTRKKRREENQEDVKHILEEIWKSDPDDTLWKISSKESKGRIDFAMNMSKEDLEYLR